MDSGIPNTTIHDESTVTHIDQQNQSFPRRPFVLREGIFAFFFPPPFFLDRLFFFLRLHYRYWINGRLWQQGIRYFRLVCAMNNRELSRTDSSLLLKRPRRRSFNRLHVKRRDRVQQGNTYESKKWRRCYFFTPLMDVYFQAAIEEGGRIRIRRSTSIGLDMDKYSFDGRLDREILDLVHRSMIEMIDLLFLVHGGLKRRLFFDDGF